MPPDLRDWIEQMRSIQELKDVKGAEVELEIGALTDLNAKHHGQALLFSHIPGYKGEGRVLSCSLSRGARLAKTLGYDHTLTDLELIEALRGVPEQWEQNASEYPTNVVNDAPMFEKTFEGDRIDMERYPAPLWHEGDGGRYIGTGGTVITRDPETGNINSGTYRVMIHEDDEVGVYIEPINHGSIHMKKYHENGEPCPIAASFGHHPIMYLASSMPMPYEMSEQQYAGSMFGEPIDVVEGPETGLPIPAQSELAIEGWVEPGDMRDEGPFGEFTGYFAGGRHPRPNIKVKRVYQRENPVIYGSPPGKPPFDHSYWRTALESSMILDRLKTAGVPEVKDVWRHESGCSQFWLLVAIDQQFEGHATQAGSVAAMCGEGASMGRYIIVVDEDVNIRDMDEVIWTLSTRTDPKQDIQFLETTPSNHLDPMVEEDDKTHKTSRAIINACRPFHRKDDFPRVAEVSDDLAEKMREKWGEELGWDGRG